MREKIDFLLATLDYHLASGKSIEEAWNQTLENYVFVYHDRDVGESRDRIHHICGTGKLRQEKLIHPISNIQSPISKKERSQ